MGMGRWLGSDIGISGTRNMEDRTLHWTYRERHQLTVAVISQALI